MSGKQFAKVKSRLNDMRRVNETGFSGCCFLFFVYPQDYTSITSKGPILFLKLEKSSV